MHQAIGDDDDDRETDSPKLHHQLAGDGTRFDHVADPIYLKHSYDI